MNSRTFTIRAKLIAAFAAIVAVVALLSMLGLHALRSEHQAFEDFVHETSVRVQHANDARDAAFARAVAARNLVLVTAQADVAREQAAVTAAHERIGKALAQLADELRTMHNVSERERQLFATLQDVESRYSKVALEIVGLASQGRRDEAVRRMNADCRPLLAALLAAADAYLAQMQTQAAAQVEASSAAYRFNLALTIAGCLLAIGVGVAASVLLTRAIVTPIEHAVTIARSVAEGNLGSNIVVARRDETGRLLSALKAMNDSLVNIVRNVRQSSDSIATGSAQIASGNADLSSRTEQQASSLQQTAASMEQMTATVQHSAANAQQAAKLAVAASEAAARGGAVVSQVVGTMDEISASSRRIADIIGVIDGIAFQTNILALNAAVEAARAGEQGRGFAVVAGEVRALAQRSAEAAREIKALIDASAGKVEAGTRLVGETRTSMDDIVTQVQRVADLIREIDGATAEQNQGIGQVNVAVSQLDQATQQNAALVEQSAAAAESLKQQAQRLAQAVSVFRLDDSRAAA